VPAALVAVPIVEVSADATTLMYLPDDFEANLHDEGDGEKLEINWWFPSEDHEQDCFNRSAAAAASKNSTRTDAGRRMK
jgi:hypothetical protein